jgi:nitroreductase
MQLDDVLARRRMTRRFDASRPVPHDLISAIVRNAVRAPSAGFTQGWDFVVLTRPQDRDDFWAATSPDGPADAWLQGVSAAPLLILCCSNPTAYLDRYAEPDKGWTDRNPARWPIPYWDVDTGMAALLMLLTAEDTGLGGLFFGVPAQAHDAVRAAFSIPDDRRLVGVVACGYPQPSAEDDPPGPPRRRPRRRRRPLQEVVHADNFTNPRDVRF